MATIKGRMALSFVTAALAAGSLYARTPQETLRVNAASDRLMADRAQLGLDADNAFRLRGSHSDELGQTHGHFAQAYKGVKVWGGDAITHTGRDGSELPLTNALHKNIRLNVTPSLGAGEALAAAQMDLAPMGAYAYAPTTELVVYPQMTDVIVRRAGRLAVDQEINATDVTRQVVRYSLAYHVHTELENDQDGIRHTDYLVDAHTGAILKKWNTLHTTAATGTGNSQYSGVVSLATNYTGTTYEMRDMTRGTAGTFGNNVVTDMNHATTTSTATGTLYTDADNTWGDGTNYVEGSSTTAANGQTAAVDAMFGMAKSWDFFKLVYGRNGIDGAGTATYSRVHISNSYDNAFWSDSCFCMTYGDGSSFTTLTALDVAGHEMSHGVTSRTANLTYSGESGGLNESTSDIFGTMIEYYARGGSGATIGSTGGNWTIGEQLAATPLRYMYKPSLDGASPDAWSSTLGTLDVHYSSGPMNRGFYFLSQGASSTSTSTSYTSYLPTGMTGIGNDKASAIWFRALTTYLTSSSNYAAARTAAISAAKDLYTAGSAEEQAVWNAFHGINVGLAWSTTPPPPTSTFTETEPNDLVGTANAVARTFTAIQGNLTVTTDKDYFGLTMNPGETLAFAMTGPTGVDWDLKVVDAAGTQLAISQGSAATENITYTNTGTTIKAVYANVYVYSGTSATPYNVALTYSGGTTPVPDTTAPTVSATEIGTSGTITFNATASDNVGVTKVEFYVDGVLKGTDTTSPYSMTLNSTTLTNATHSLTAKAYDAAGNATTSTAVNFTINNTTATSFTEVESNGTTAAANVIADTITTIVGKIGTSTDLDYFKINVAAGRTVTVNMTGPAKDYDLYLLSSTGATLKSSLGTTATESVTYTNTGTTTAVYYIKVLGYAGAFDTVNSYTLALTR
ncbi:MAG: M4 family metallopeptidase [Geothrix sp.]|nr:M4 family metallopeptidase [Geothrix sp.]